MRRPPTSPASSGSPLVPLLVVGALAQTPAGD